MPDTMEYNWVSRKHGKEKAQRFRRYMMTGDKRDYKKHELIFGKDSADELFRDHMEDVKHDEKEIRVRSYSLDDINSLDDITSTSKPLTNPQTHLTNPQSQTPCCWAGLFALFSLSGKDIKQKHDVAPQLIACNNRYNSKA